jgi:hypothetical protein
MEKKLQMPTSKIFAIMLTAIRWEIKILQLGKAKSK